MFYRGQQIVCKVAKADFLTQYGSDSLVHYEPVTNMVTVDRSASKLYTKYAALHECLCCGRYKHLAPQVSDPTKRCGEIDKVLLGTLPAAEAEQYRRKRIEMFETLLEKGLNRPLDDRFSASLEMLKAL